MITYTDCEDCECGDAEFEIDEVTSTITCIGCGYSIPLDATDMANLINSLKD